MASNDVSTEDFMLREPWRMPASSARELTALLGITDRHLAFAMAQGVETIGSRYRRWKKQETITAAIRAQRRVYDAWARAGDHCATIPVGPPLNTLAEFVVFCERSGELSEAQLARLRSFRAPMGPHARNSSYYLAWDLCLLYEKVTGRRVTHSPYRRARYTGHPCSTAGAFVEAAMRAIDPQLTISRITTSVRYAADELRHNRAPRADKAASETL
jgi:hypothetical protein